MSDAGVAAGQQLAAALRPTLPLGIRIVSSPRLRARQTAGVIASFVSPVTVEIDDRWSETDFGIAEGHTFDELAMVAPKVAARLASGDTEIDWPCGETAVSLRARVEAAWQDLTSQNGPVLVVSHGGPLRIAIALATDRGPGEVSVPETGGVWRSTSGNGPDGARGASRLPMIRFPS